MNYVQLVMKTNMQLRSSFNTPTKFYFNFDSLPGVIILNVEVNEAQYIAEYLATNQKIEDVLQLSLANLIPVGAKLEINVNMLE